MESYIDTNTHELMQDVFKYDDINTLINITKKNRKFNIFEYICVHIVCVETYLWDNGLDRNQISMVKALTNEKYNILNFMIGLKPHKFSSIDFSKVIVFSDTDKSGQFIEKMIPYKYKHKCTNSNPNRSKVSRVSAEPYYVNDNIVKYYCTNYKRYPYDIEFVRGEDEPPCYILYHSVKCIIKDASERKYDITFKKTTKEEMQILKWNDRKGVMLLGYGAQNNSFKSLPEDLIKQIFLFTFT